MDHYEHRSDEILLEFGKILRDFGAQVKMFRGMDYIASTLEKQRFLSTNGRHDNSDNLELYSDSEQYRFLETGAMGEKNVLISTPWYRLCSYNSSKVQYLSVNHQATAVRLCKYSFRYGLTSTSGPRLSGVHFGSSLNNLIATMYYKKSDNKFPNYQRLYSHSCYPS